jgi:hypothetical protein
MPQLVFRSPSSGRRRIIKPRLSAEERIIKTRIALGDTYREARNYLKWINACIEVESLNKQFA